MLPNLSSDNAVSESDSAVDSFLTTTPNVATTLVTVLVSDASGATLTKLTVSLSSSVTGSPSSSVPEAVTVFVCDVFALPVTFVENEQLWLPPGAMTHGGVTSQVPWPSRLPNLSSTRLLIVTVST